MVKITRAQAKEMLRKKGKRHKYNAHPTMVDGIRFDSKKEARRYVELKALADAGMITDLELQVPYPIHVNGQLICTYFSDFRYGQDGETVVEDAKGLRTREYKLKRALVFACYGIEIVEV